MDSQFHLKFILHKSPITVYCAVPENIHTPQKGLEFPGGWGVLQGQKI